jgi:hypothetical protein
MVSIAVGKIIYVDADASGANDGSSWADAYNYLQDALSNANTAPKPVEIRVAQGTYWPDQGAGIVPGDPKATFGLINDVSVKGGYAGFGRTDQDTRHVKFYETILSGDLNNNDIDVNDPCDLRVEATRSDNSQHVVVGSNTSRSALLDGFTVTGGFYTGVVPRNGSHVGGGGMRNESGSPTLIDCTFTGNGVVSGSGGGLLNTEGSAPIPVNCTFIANYAEQGAGVCNVNSSPMLDNCTFDNNSAFYGSGMYNSHSCLTLMNCTFSRNSASGNTYEPNKGGAMFNTRSNCALSECVFAENMAELGGGICNEDNSSINLTKCIFMSNSARRSGGGMWNVDSSAMLGNCMFSGNSAKDFGGGMSNSFSELTLSNCTFGGNVARKWGGGMFSNYSDPTLVNCTLGHNWASEGTGVYNYASNPKLSQCILWNAGDQIHNFLGSTPIISYSDVRSGWLGDGNIDADPCFVDPGRWVNENDPNEIVEPNDPNAVWIDGDYHLKSQAGRWDCETRSWVKDDVTSPCIDAGDMGSPIGYEPFPNGGIINMGAYGGTGEASKSYLGQPVCETIVAGDINGDCVIDFKDFEFVALHWLTDNNP